MYIFPFICLLCFPNSNVNCRRAGALQFTAASSQQQVLRKYVLDGFMSGKGLLGTCMWNRGLRMRQSCLCTQLVSEAQEEERAGAGTPRQAKGKKKSPEWLNRDEQGGSNTNWWDLAGRPDSYNARPCRPQSGVWISFQGQWEATESFALTWHRVMPPCTGRGQLKYLCGVGMRWG